MRNDELELCESTLAKLGYERCESYLSSARAVLHLHQDSFEHSEQLPIENLWHLLNLMSIEIRVLSDMVLADSSACG